MSVSWQAGEPPCGVRVLVEWMYRSGNPRTEVGVVSSPSRAMFCMSVDTVFLSDITILRWSTLDDDRAAKAMGSLEKLLSDETSWPWVCLEKTVCNDSYEATRYDDDGNERKVPSPTLIEAIEKLTEAGNDSR